MAAKRGHGGRSRSRRRSRRRSTFPCSYSRRADISVRDVDPRELHMGIKVEKEHVGGTKDEDRKACLIALPHLAEDERYYTHLLAMESRARAKAHARRAKAKRKR